MRTWLRRHFVGYEHHRKDEDTPYLLGGVLLTLFLAAGLFVTASPLIARFTRTYTNVAAVITATLVELANADRAANSAGALVTNPVLAAAAQAKANDMAAKGYFAHFDSVGKGPWDWMKEAGYEYRYAGENLAVEFSESTDVERAWLNSPTHRQNLLDPRFTEVGIATADGMYEGRPTTFVVQFFGTPAPVLALRETPAVSEPQPTETQSTSTLNAANTNTQVLGLVTSEPKTQPMRAAPSAHTAIATTTPASTTPVLVARTETPPTLPAQVHAAPASAVSLVPQMPRFALALIALLSVLALLAAAVHEFRETHLKHAFYATSLSAVSMAIALVVVAIPHGAPLLDNHPIAFAADPSAHVALVVPADGRVYAAGAPVGAPVQTAAAATVDIAALQAYLASSALVPLFALVAVFGVVAAAIRYLRNAPVRVNTDAQHLVQQLAAMTDNLNQAERIGGFGSFFWDYQDSDSSYWSDELYALLGLIKRKHTPPIDTFVGSAAPEDAPQVREAIARATTQPGAFSFTFRAVAPDKSSRALRVEGTTTIRDTGKAWRIHGFARDITRETEIDKSKSEFVSLASHQLKTPLTAIRWLVEAMQGGAVGQFTPAQREYVDKIGRSAQNMITIVNDLLSVSRIELNRLATQIEDIDVHALAQSVIDEQQHAADTRRIALAFTSADVPHIQADKNALRMIFQNLISNAIKYTSEGGSVKVDVSVAGARQQAIYLSVSDTGIGIPKAEQSRVFEKLHRASNAQALAVEGTGLGLYVVKTVIEKAGGAITFDSIEGKGTTFTVTIPLVWQSAQSSGIGTLA